MLVSWRRSIARRLSADETKFAPRRYEAVDNRLVPRMLERGWGGCNCYTTTLADERQRAPRQAVSDLTLDKLILQEAARGSY